MIGLRTNRNGRSSRVPDQGSLFASFAANTIVGGVALAVAAQVLAQILALEASHFGKAMALYVVIAASVTAAFRLHAPHNVFGAANRVTLSRAVLVSLLAGFVGYEPLLPQHFWLLAGFASLVLLLDGLDGWMARKLSATSPLGALFDQELDAVLILILGVLVYDTGKVGIWVIASGLLRYALLLAGLLWPKLRRAPPASLRGRAVCVFQIVVLIGSLAPITPSLIASALAAMGLAALLGSFGRDVVWLIRQDLAPPGQPDQKP